MEMEYDDYIQLLKMVGFPHFNVWLCHVDPFISFGMGLMVLEVTTPRSSRFWSLNGSITNSSQILRLTLMINTPVDSLTMHAASSSAWLSSIGMTHCK
jgi:hypothetical protein